MRRSAKSYSQTAASTFCTKDTCAIWKRPKDWGDVLIVGLNSDSSVKRLKGESRPINDESARSTVLAALEAVDYVVIFTEDTPLNLIKTVAPDVLVKGGDYAIENIVGREYAQETVTIPFVDGYSTTKTIGAINQEKAIIFSATCWGVISTIHF